MQIVQLFLETLISQSATAFQQICFRSAWMRMQQLRAELVAETAQEATDCSLPQSADRPEQSCPAAAAAADPRAPTFSVNALVGVVGISDPVVAAIRGYLRRAGHPERLL